MLLQQQVSQWRRFCLFCSTIKPVGEIIIGRVHLRQPPQPATAISCIKNKHNNGKCTTLSQKDLKYVREEEIIFENIFMMIQKHYLLLFYSSARNFITEIKILAPF